jgi:hypothetical protein
MSESLSRRSLLAGAVASAAVVPLANLELDSSGLFEKLKSEYQWQLMPYQSEEPIEVRADECAKEAMRAGMTAVRRARLAAGLSMAEAAELAGVGFWRWSQIECNQYQAMSPELEFSEGMAVCELLNIEPDAIYQQIRRSA